MLELVLGGARSGKSRVAEQRALASGLRRCYIATAQAGDGEMAQRIARHRADRSEGWLTIEEPLQLARVLREQDDASRCLLVDCLTLWLTNLLIDDDPTLFARERENFLNTLAQARSHIILVSNEVGHGVVPMDALSRRFVDESGWLHQELAQHCDNVLWVVAGLPQALKGTL